MKTQANTQAGRWRLALVLLLLAALWIRMPMPSMGWTHIDEKAFVNHPLGFFSGDLNPHFFNYPTLQLYLTAAIYLGYWATTGDELLDFVAWHTFVEAGDLLSLARGLTSLMAVLTVGVTACIGRRLYGPTWGLAAAGLLACAPLHVRFSHLAATDVPSVLWVSLTVLWAVRAVQSRNSRDMLLAGVFCGLAAATKYPGVFCGAAILTASWVGFPDHRIRVLFSSAAGAALAFSFASPYVLLDLHTAVRDITAMAREHATDGLLHTTANSSLDHLVTHNLRFGLGLLTCLAVAASLLWRRRACHSHVAGRAIRRMPGSAPLSNWSSRMKMRQTLTRSSTSQPPSMYASPAARLPPVAMRR